MLCTGRTWRGALVQSRCGSSRLDFVVRISVENDTRVMTGTVLSRPLGADTNTAKAHSYDKRSNLCISPAMNAPFVVNINDTANLILF